MSSIEKPNWEVKLCCDNIEQLGFYNSPIESGHNCSYGVIGSGVCIHPRMYEWEIIPLESRHRCIVDNGLCSICYLDGDLCQCKDDDYMGCKFCNTLMTTEEFEIHKKDMVQSENNFASELEKKEDDF